MIVIRPSPRLSRKFTYSVKVHYIGEVMAAVNLKFSVVVRAGDHCLTLEEVLNFEAMYDYLAIEKFSGNFLISTNFISTTYFGF